MKILVTGAAGYIGGTFAFEALKKGYKVFGLDNFSNSTDFVPSILSRKFKKNWVFTELDLVHHKAETIEFFNQAKPDVVIHFAGLKAVGESEIQPIWYWENNLISSINLLKCMKATGVKKLVFSSSATVYGDAKQQPITETQPTKSLSSYGSTKIAIEQLIYDACKSKNMNAVCLRYFNPVGAHEENIIFESPLGEPNNLMPRIVRVGLGIDKKIKIFGHDYSTSDKTAERDYIHISDLVDGHFAGVQYLAKMSGCHSVNLGTGKPTSVLELINAFQQHNNIEIPFEFCNRRLGDVETCYANPTLAESLLGWRAKYGLDLMCKSAWGAVKKNGL